MEVLGLYMARVVVMVDYKPAPTPPPLRKENTEGVLPRAARGGNPFQMLNPKAPAQYGKAEDSVVLDPDTGKWKGIKLFTINF